MVFSKILDNLTSLISSKKMKKLKKIKFRKNK